MNRNMPPIKVFGLALLMVLGLGGCKSTPETATDYDPGEFALLLATSNQGEVGPCG